MSNNVKNILVTGASGYIGTYLLKELVNKSELKVTAVYNSHPVNMSGVNSLKCDLADAKNLTTIFNDTNTDTVIHLASGTPMRITGKSDEQIKQINVDSTGHIAKLCSEHGSLLIFTSSDLVYEDGLNLNEDQAKLNPVTPYAISKLEAEEAVRNFASKYIIFRTALVYGFTQSLYQSFFDTAYAELNGGRKIKAFVDQYRNAIYVEDAVHIISEIPQLYEENNIINLCGNEYLSRFDMCKQMAEIYNFKQNQIIPSCTDDFTRYPIVKQIGLNNEKLIKLGFTTHTYRTNLLRAMNYKP